jgi:hypothetical protein
LMFADDLFEAGGGGQGLVEALDLQDRTKFQPMR